VCRVDHQGVGPLARRSQLQQHPGKHALLAPTLSAVEALCAYGAFYLNELYVILKSALITARSENKTCRLAFLDISDARMDTGREVSLLVSPLLETTNSW